MIIVVVALVLLLGGCAVSVAPELPYLSHLTPQQQQQRLIAWEFGGRVVVNMASESWPASLRWQQVASGYRLAIEAPLGQGSLRLSGGGSEVLLESDTGEQWRAGSARELLQQQLGWELPLESLRYWVVGVPAPGEFRQRLSREGDMALLEQQGWQLELSGYRPYDGYRLPHKIIARAEDSSVKVAISRWQLGLGELSL